MQFNKECRWGAGTGTKQVVKQKKGGNRVTEETYWSQDSVILLLVEQLLLHAKSYTLLLTVGIFSYNYHRMALVGRDLRDHQAPTR